MADIPQKISQADPVSPIDPGKAEKKSKGAGSGAFERILTEQISDGGTSSVRDSQPGLPEIQGSFRAAHISGIHKQITADQARFLEQMTASLDLFDQYAAFLGDSDKNLKQTYSLLEQILQLTGNLSKDLANYQSEDTAALGDLRSMAEQLLTTARVEQIKFDRGDYL